MLTCRNDLVGVLLVKDGDGVGSYHLMQRKLHRSEQVARLLHLDIFNQLDEHFRICVRDKRDAIFFKFTFDDRIVLNDAVVYDGEIV